MKTLRISILFWALAIVGVGSIAVAQSRPFPKAPAYTPHPKGEFPLIASYAFSHPMINAQQFEWVKEAGFNTIVQWNSYEDADSCLKLAKQFDIPMAISGWGGLDSAAIVDRVQRYGADPYVWGFRAGDEPNVSRFPELAKIKSWYYDLVPSQNVFINLFPNVSGDLLGVSDYRTYVEEFVHTVNPAFISYDSYPIKVNEDGEMYVQRGFYYVVNIIGDVARKSERPFWGYILCDAYQDFPKPTPETIRFQVFANLAYGAQGLSYFTYQLPDFDRGKGEFTEAPIDENGNRTDTWYIVRDINREVKNLEKVFLGAEVLDVSFTGPYIPVGNKKLETLPKPFLYVEPNGEGVLVSHLRNGKDEYLMILNHDINKKQKIRLARTHPVTRIYPNGKERKENGPTFTLAPASYAIFRIS